MTYYQVTMTPAKHGAKHRVVTTGAQLTFLLFTILKGLHQQFPTKGLWTPVGLKQDFQRCKVLFSSLYA